LSKVYALNDFKAFLLARSPHPCLTVSLAICICNFSRDLSLTQYLLPDNIFVDVKAILGIHSRLQLKVVW